MKTALTPRMAELHRRLAELHDQQAAVHRELAEELADAEAPTPKSVTRAKRRPYLVAVPTAPVSDLAAADARRQLEKLGFKKR